MLKASSGDRENEGSSGTGAFYLYVPPTLLLAYVMSPPFAAKVLFVCGFSYHDSVGSVLRWFYLPLKFLYEHFPPYRGLMDFLMKLMGVH